MVDFFSDLITDKIDLDKSVWDKRLILGRIKI